MSAHTNGVNVAALVDTIGAIKADPAIAAFTFRASNNWIDGGLNRTRIEPCYGAKQEHQRPAAFVFSNDEPPVLLGQDRGANPAEFVLHAMAGCITTTLVYHAAARGIAVTSVSTRFEGDIDLRGMLAMDPAMRAGYQGIRVEIAVDADAPAPQLRELVAFAMAHSPVFNTVMNPVPVAVSMAGEPVLAAAA